MVGYGHVFLTLITHQSPHCCPRRRRHIRTMSRCIMGAVQVVNAFGQVGAPSPMDTFYEQDGASNLDGPTTSPAGGSATPPPSQPAASQRSVCGTDFVDFLVMAAILGAMGVLVCVLVGV